MANTVRLVRRSLVAALLVGTMVGGARVASAQQPQVSDVSISGTWLYHVVLTKPYDNAYYLATITQSAGILSGTVRETDKTCGGALSGSLSGTTVTMTWRFPVSCSGDILHLRGTLGNTGTTMSGTVTSPDHGPGTFAGKKR